MDKLVFEGYSEYGDSGIEEFSFIYNGDRYKILPKYNVPGSKDKLRGFMEFVKYKAPKLDNNPWKYNVNAQHDFSRVFDIYKNGMLLKDKKLPPPPDAEQLDLFSFPKAASVSTHRVVLSYLSKQDK